MMKSCKGKMKSKAKKVIKEAIHEDKEIMKAVKAKAKKK